ncbi:MAG: hypothetical protein H2038_08470 [Brevundimonas sp.]|uniref:capsular polysaccharide export protein, LipB/KpsS family n=1 Tax=Brevundimonas sp. TaxID=1871086 RepID=UPI0018464A61|nr:hypothetical protein [Brevundimonas sp.]MBA4804667.1 hypothetical protein [Brevundimonas sp.]
MLTRLKQIIGFNPVTWALSSGVMSQRVEEFLETAPPPTSPTGPQCLVVISPWVGTAVPWFSLAVGLMLAAEGASVTFVIDDQRFGGNALRHAVIVRAIRRVMARVGKRFPVLQLSDIDAAPLRPDDGVEIDRLARLNATWKLRGEIIQTGRAALEEANRRQISAAYGRIAGVFQGRACDMLFVPGGVYGASGIWSLLARRANVRVATYDTGGYETVMLAADGLACQLQDVPRAFAAVRKRSADTPGERAAILAAANEEISKRQQGRDTFASQVRDSGAPDQVLRGGVLIALNSSWDAAALGPHEVFPGNTEWIVQTVRHLLDHTAAPVIVRQHPAERLAFASTTDDYRALLEKHFGDHPRLHFIAAADPINSYALLEQVSAVVVHTSTIGIEAAAFGRPVVTGSTAYYSGLAFVNRADTLEEYHRLLEAAARGDLHVTPAMQEDARICFYVTQCRNWVFSTFNPADYVRWSREPLQHWRSQPAVRRMLESLLTNTPVAELNHAAHPLGGP